MSTVVTTTRPDRAGDLEADLALDHFFELSQDLMAIASTDDGKFKRVNPAFTKVLGLSRQELLATPAAKLVHPSDLAGCHDAERALRERRTVTLDNRMRTARDGYVTISWTLSPHPATGLYYCVGHDVTRLRTAIAEREQQAALLGDQVRELEAIYDRAPVGLALIDHNFCFKRVNRRLAEINGVSAVDHIGKHIWDVVPDVRDTAEPALRSVLDEGRTMTNIEIVGTTKSAPDQVRNWREHFYPIEQATSRSIGVICEEVTELERYARALSDNEARLRIALMGAKAGVWDWTFATGETFWSPEMYALLGVDTATTPSIDVFAAAILAEDRERTMTEFHHAAVSGAENFSLEFRIKRPNGDISWLSAIGCIERDGQGAPIRARGVNQNITDRKTAELRLATSEAQLREAIKAGRVFAFEWHRASDASERSDGAAAILALGEEGWPLSGRTYISHVHPDDRRHLLRVTTSDRTPENPSYEVAYRFIRPDGGVLWLEETGAATFDDTGRRTGVRGLCRDVTARKAAEEHNQLLMHEISHRGKNILAVVQAVVRFTSADTVEDYALAVRRRVQALARVQGLLASAGWHGAALSDLLACEFEPYGGNDDRIRMTGEHVLIETHAVQTLTLIVHELATNAAKYGALATEHGKLAISWHQTGNGGLEITWRESGGPPVSVPKHRGFGSRLIEQSLRQLGGDATFDYAPAGLTCHLRVGNHALASGPPTSRKQPQAPRQLTAIRPLAGLRVLVIEDEPLLAEEIRESLTEAGCVTLGPAATLDEALRLAATETLDSCTLNVSLSGHSTKAIAEVLHARSIPFIVATGFERTVTDAFHCPVVEKPFSPESLREALGRALSAQQSA